MQPLQFGAIHGTLEVVIPFVVFALALVNLVTRHLAHRSHVSQADEHGADGIERTSFHTLSTLALVLATFAYVMVDLHYGVALAAFALTAFVADFFEFEARLVEARTDRPLEAPKAAIGASLFIVAYAGYIVLVELFGAFWSPII
ncbi:DUF7313 family protein [Halalkalicoccus jeotgali]|uniref:DUF7313 domain-containing protein n=1 Tax=Halalkalicoccus jeotgali (strain DSM 18796 / CECT 7217 / JCM 14584 / KCTC 4019 / B3) TaxID=795797 RepID=D8J4Y4_HALJB|nr:hypothetical protein [Halalkalicoccus jeotgali]ADJ15601.1 hypothetical protein HacjB3_11090 [Halalkalicoccus jeotgali B3]ELY36321.1 hypothetical protein C497_11573 [Halalkalicoccus jeotgali B3]